MKKEIINHLSWLANSMAQVKLYGGWSNESKIKEIEKSFDTFFNSLIQNNHIDLKSITVEEAKELRFGKWDEEGDLWLFPLWIVPLIPEGLEVTFIDGTTILYEKDKMDNDIRFGCVCYGINIKE